MKELLEKLKKYGFTCEAGNLENCDDFKQLEKLCNQPPLEGEVTFGDIVKFLKDNGFNEQETDYLGNTIDLAGLLEDFIKQVFIQSPKPVEGDVRGEAIDKINDILENEHILNPDKKDKNCWFIENSKGEWYSVSSRLTGYFSNDPNKALIFHTKKSAEEILNKSYNQKDLMKGCAVTEHIFPYVKSYHPLVIKLVDALLSKYNFTPKG